MVLTVPRTELPSEPLGFVVLLACEACLTWNQAQSTSHHALLLVVPDFFQLCAQTIICLYTKIKKGIQNQQDKVSLYLQATALETTKTSLIHIPR